MSRFFSGVFFGGLFGILAGFFAALFGKFLPDKDYSALLAERNRMYIMWKGTEEIGLFANIALDSERSGAKITYLRPNAGFSIERDGSGDTVVTQDWYLEAYDSDLSPLSVEKQKLLVERMREAEERVHLRDPSFRITKIDWDAKEHRMNVSWTYRYKPEDLQKKGTDLLLSGGIPMR